jgi:hypothetical protein
MDTTAEYRSASRAIVVAIVSGVAATRESIV